jgi:hypothetical protein
MMELKWPTVSADAVQYRAHLLTLRQKLGETAIVVRRGARAYVESRALLDQITQTGRPELPETGGDTAPG